VDFLDPEAAAIIQKKMKAEGVAEIAILINNVGGIPDLSAQEAFSAMMELSVESADKVSRLNVGTPVSMVRTFVPAMVQRKRGCVIFVGSLSRLAPAYLSHYGSDKAKLATMAYGMVRPTSHRTSFKECRIWNMLLSESEWRSWRVVK